MVKSAAASGIMAAGAGRPVPGGRTAAAASERGIMIRHEVLLWIFLVPMLHFLFSILFVGAGLLLLLRERFPRRKFPEPGNFLAAVAAGVIFNGAQFALAVLLAGRPLLASPSWLGIGKYA